MPSLVAALDAAPLTAAHRHGHEEHHEHDGYRNDDYDDSRRYGCNWDQQGVAHFVSSKPSGRKATPTRRAANGWRTDSSRRRHGQSAAADTFSFVRRAWRVAKRSVVSFY